MFLLPVCPAFILPVWPPYIFGMYDALPAFFTCMYLISCLNVLPCICHLYVLHACPVFISCLNVLPVVLPGFLFLFFAIMCCLYFLPV